MFGSNNKLTTFVLTLSS